MTLNYKRLVAKVTPKNAHLMKKNGTMPGFVENKGQSGPLSIVSKT